MEIGDLIRAKRKELGLSQAKLAERVQVNKSAVAQWELNQTRPSQENMVAIKAILGIDAGVEAAPGAPYRGKLVEDPDLLAWLEFLEMIPSAERRVLAKHIMGGMVARPKAKDG